jgi:hypothetical protein
MGPFEEPAQPRDDLTRGLVCVGSNATHPVLMRRPATCDQIDVDRRRRGRRPGPGRGSKKCVSSTRSTRLQSAAARSERDAVDQRSVADQVRP